MKVLVIALEVTESAEETTRDLQDILNAYLEDRKHMEGPNGTFTSFDGFREGDWEEMELRSAYLASFLDAYVGKP